MKAKKIRIQFSMILFFIAWAAVIFFLLDSRRDHNHEQHLQQVTERYQLAYNTIYAQYMQLATIICSGIVDEYDIRGVYRKLLTADKEKKNRLRADLLTRIEPRYREIKTIGKVRQLHFHLRNNESFLRLHRPERYGDDLTGIRETVNYVNTKHLPIDGFEEGRIFNGYRFVFPVTGTDQTHLGSMEISFGPNALTSAMMEQYTVLSNFFIRETVIRKKIFPGEFEKTYTQAPHNKFLYDKNVLETLRKVSRKEMKDLKPPKATIDAIYANAHSGRAMTFYDHSIHSAFTTIPVSNPVTREMVAFFTVRSQPDFIIREKQLFRLYFSMSLIFLTMILSIFYIQYSKRKILESNTLQLEEQKTQLLETQKIATIGHWVLDHKANQLHWSDQTNRIFGLQPGENTGGYDTFLEKVHPDDRDFVYNAFTDSVEKQLPYDIQHRIVTADGTNRWVREKCITEYDQSGAPLSSLGIIHDITLQHDTVADLQRERDMFMNGPVATFTWRNSTDWPVEYVSANIINILGYSQEEFLNGSLVYAQLIHPDDLQRVLDEVVRNSTPDNIGFIHEPYRLINSQGEFVWVLDNTTLRRNKQGEITHYLGYLVDITKMVLMEEEVLTTKRLLARTRFEEQRKRFESLKTMAGAIAHRFNNAMMGVQGNLELLLLDLPKNSEEHQQALGATRAARGAAQIGSMMLSYVGQQLLKCQLFSLEELVRESVAALRDLFKPLISLNITPPPSPLYCSVDQDQIKEVIENLLTNAVEALDKDSGTIDISFGTDSFSKSSFPIPFQDEKLMDGIYSFCRIKDSGHGIRPENLSRIFEPFYTTKFVGRGLGLALAVGVIRAHHGAITIDSEPGIGTTVTILLPAASTPKQTKPASGRELSKPVQLSGNILFGDDDETVLDVGTKMLEILGFSVHTVANGQEAVSEIKKHTTEFCAVILDISMPQMDGIAAMKTIKKINPALPVLLSSGSAEEDFSFNKDDGGVPDGFLAKPFLLPSLRSKLEDILS